MEGVRTYPDHKSMRDSEDLDAVSVCTYNATHAECTIYALQKGVNVMLEKPRGQPGDRCHHKGQDRNPVLGLKNY